MALEITFLFLLAISWQLRFLSAAWVEDFAAGTASLIFDNDQVTVWDNLLKEELWKLGNSQERYHECTSSVWDKDLYKFTFRKIQRRVTNLTKVYTQEYENARLGVAFYRDFIFHDDKNSTAVILQETYRKLRNNTKLRDFNFISLCVHFYKRQYRRAYFDNGTLVKGINTSARHLLLDRNRYLKKLDFPISIVESAGGATCYTNITAYKTFPTLYANISKVTSSRFQLVARRGHYLYAKRTGMLPGLCDTFTLSYVMSINQMDPSYCPTFLTKVGNHSIQSLSHRFGGKIGLYEDYINDLGVGKDVNVPLVYSYSLFGIATSAAKDAVYANTSDFFGFLKQRARAQIALLDYSRTLHDFKVPYSWGSKECGVGMPLNHWEVYNLCQIGRFTMITMVQIGGHIFPKDILQLVVKLITAHRRPLNGKPWFPHSFDEKGNWLCPEFVLNTHLDSLQLILMFSFLDPSFYMTWTRSNSKATEDFPHLQQYMESAIQALVDNIDCFILQSDEGILFAYACPEDGEPEFAEIEPWMYGYHYYSTFLLATVIEFAEAKGLNFNKVKLRSILKDACRRTLTLARSKDYKRYIGKNSDIIYICAFIVDEINRTSNYNFLVKVGGVPVVEAIATGRHLIDFGPPDTLYLHKIPSVPVILFDISPNSTFLANQNSFRTKGLANLVHANPDFPYPLPENVHRSRFKRIFLLSNVGYNGLEISDRGEIGVEAFSSRSKYHSVYMKYLATEDPPFIIYSSEVPLHVRQISKRLSGLRAELKSKHKIKLTFRSKLSGDVVTITRSCRFSLDAVSVAVEIKGQYFVIDAFSPSQHFLYISVLLQSSRAVNFLDGTYQACVSEFLDEPLVFKSPFRAKIGDKVFIVFNQTVLTQYFNVTWKAPSGKQMIPTYDRLSSPDIIEEFNGLFLRQAAKEDFGTYHYNFTSIDANGVIKKVKGEVDLVQNH